MIVSASPTIVIAPDSFKGSATSAEAAAAMARGARAAFGVNARVVEIPMADGGEGALDTLLSVWGQSPRTMTVSDAIGRERLARFGVSPDGRTAVIEAAEANGLPWVQDVPFQPMRADSFGVGMIAAALISEGVQEILLCVGGSASTDAGTGLLSALGIRFLDENGIEVATGGAGLSSISSIDMSGLQAGARDVAWRIAVDVVNPLCGKNGAASVFAPQKGATAGEVDKLERGLAHFAGVLAFQTGNIAEDLTTKPGYGAAGGVPLALAALLDAQIIGGAELVADAVGLQEELTNADLVITGEGRLDSQSIGGKVVDVVRRLTPASVPLIVIAGAVDLSAAECRATGITAAFSIARGASTTTQLIENAENLIEEVSEHACAVVACAQQFYRSLESKGAFA